MLVKNLNLNYLKQKNNNLKLKQSFIDDIVSKCKGTFNASTRNWVTYQTP